MAIFRNTIRQSRRERIRRIDRTFEVVARIVLIVSFLFSFASWLSARPSVQITSVDVLGTQAVDGALVKHIVESQLARRLLYRIDRDNLLLYPKRAMNSAIRGVDTRIKEVDIHVEDKRRLVVRVSEYIPAYLWCPPDSGAATTSVTHGCLFADSAGYLFTLAPGYSGSPFLIFVTTRSGDDNRHVLAQEEFARVNTFLEKLTALGLHPHLVWQSGLHDFTITTDKPWEVRWSSERDPEEDARNLALVLQNLNNGQALAQLEAIDLRFGNKVFYR